MAIKMRKTQTRLNFDESKPQVHILRQLVYAPIKGKNLVKYIANSANVPVSTIEACISAISEAIAYYAINGHRVVFPDLGGFYITFRSKTAKTLSEVKVEDVLKTIRLAFAPCEEIREAIAGSGTTIVDDGVYETE
jgi:nucleoid DNA-binding protein